MSSDAGRSNWQRFIGWWNWRPRKRGDRVSEVTSSAAEPRTPANAERVEAWEDEGGATAPRPAEGGNARSAPPTGPAH